MIIALMIVAMTHCSAIIRKQFSIWQKEDKSESFIDEGTAIYIKHSVKTNVSFSNDPILIYHSCIVFMTWEGCLLSLKQIQSDLVFPRRNDWGIKQIRWMIAVGILQTFFPSAAKITRKARMGRVKGSARGLKQTVPFPWIFKTSTSLLLHIFIPKPKVTHTFRARLDSRQRDG